MTSKERVLSSLAGRPTDSAVVAEATMAKSARLPVVVPGGMMCAATEELLALSGHSWEEVNRDPQAMASLARTIQQSVGLDNVGVPFCMTVEAEALGSRVALGSPLHPPRIEQEAYPDLPTDAPTPRDGRRTVVAEAVRILARTAPEVAVVGNVVGPVSVAAMVVEPGRFLRALRRRPEAAEGWLDQLTDCLISFAREQVEAGADVIVISEPSGTGQILGPADFERFVLPRLNRMCGAVRQAGARVIVHICGQLRAIARPVTSLEADALSVDAVAQVSALREVGLPVPLMGNVSTFLLHEGPVEAIRRAVERACDQGFSIVAPACGVSGATPLAHLRALVGSSTTPADIPERR